MSQYAPAAKPVAGRRHLIGLAGSFLVTVAIVLAALSMAGITPVRLATAMDQLAWRPHPPRLDLIAEASLAIRIHLGVVLAALGVGFYLVLGPKGRRAHRALGWTWAGFMLTAAISSLFIRQMSGGFSLLHIFSAATLIMTPIGVYYARRHKVAAHQKTMTGLFNGGLLVAGTFAFLPGRLMWRVFFG